MDASRSRAKRLLSYAGDALLYLRLLPASARLVWALNRRPPGLTKPQWRAVQRAVAVDRPRGHSAPGCLVHYSWHRMGALVRQWSGCTRG